MIGRFFKFYAYISAQIPCPILYVHGSLVRRCLISNAHGNGPKRVGRIFMRTEPPKNRPYGSAKIRQFWIGVGRTFDSIEQGPFLPCALRQHGCAVDCLRRLT